MQLDTKRSQDDALTEVQSSNQAWWTDHIMSYDWNDHIQLEKFSRPWFDQTDQRFIFAARLFAHGDRPFDRIMPLDMLEGKRVLEIGCGMGLHSELMARAGARLTAIDLSPTSVEVTSRRFALKGLEGDIRQMDAEQIDFPDEAFDFIWSWGVIHHSSRTGRVVREIHRLLKPGGEARVMVYSLGGMSAYLTMMLNYSWGFWRGRTLDECLWKDSDGFTARYYTKDLLTDLFRTFFDKVKVESLGQDADAIPLPKRLRKGVTRLTSKDWQARQAHRHGGFLFATVEK